MLFDVLHIECLTGHTSFNESGIAVSCQPPERGEILLFYDISKQEKAQSNLRKALEMADDEAICDGIIYRRSGESEAYCFVELKGSDLAHAIEQVSNTYKRFQEFLRKNNYLSYSNKVSWRTHIQIGSIASQKNYNKYEKDLRVRFGDRNFSVSRANKLDITDFVRGKK